MKPQRVTETTLLDHPEQDSRTGFITEPDRVSILKPQQIQDQTNRTAVTELDLLKGDDCVKHVRLGLGKHCGLG